MVICESKYLTPEGAQYLITRGGKIEQGFGLMPTVCPHLYTDIRGDDLCDIYGTKDYPLICKWFIGVAKAHGTNFWCPEGCSLKHEVNTSDKPRCDSNK
jgi:hypothetical protein